MKLSELHIGSRVRYRANPDLVGTICPNFSHTLTPDSVLVEWDLVTWITGKRQDKFQGYALTDELDPA